MPPDGGFEAADDNTRNTVKREVWEETGLSVSVGELFFVREFCEAAKDIYHLEQFYLVDQWQGGISIKSLEALTNEIRGISQACWLSRQQLVEVEVFPPS